MALGNSFKRQALLAIFSQIKFGDLKLTLPDGTTHEFAGSQKGPIADMILRSDSAIIRILGHGKMGFCEAFMLGEIDSDNLTNLIELAVLHDSYLEDQIKLELAKIMAKFSIGVIVTISPGQSATFLFIMIWVINFTADGLTAR